MSTDCRSEEGVQVSLIDTIITAAHVRLQLPYDVESEEINAALKDLSEDHNFLVLLRDAGILPKEED